MIFSYFAVGTLGSISHDGLSTSDDVSQHARCIYNVR